MPRENDMDNHFYIQRAIALSKENLAKGGGPFGAVVVKGGEIIGEGVNSVVNLHDPTAHAEVLAIRNSCLNLGTHDLSGAVIFTSCEPCPMCLAAIWWARIDKVFYANSRDDAAKIGFDDAAIYAEIAKPITERTLPLEKIDQYEALDAFKQWQSMEDKQRY